MNFNEILKQLSEGELSGEFAGLRGSGAVAPRHIPRIVTFTNEALTRLCTRFPLVTKSLILETQEGKMTYPIDSKYAETNYDSQSGIIPYIKDGANPYKDDMIKIISVFDKFGRKLPMNDSNQQWSVYTPSPLTLQVPKSYQNYALGITYQAKHPVITEDLDCEQEIIIPDVLVPALLAYVGYKHCFSRSTPESQAMAAAFKNVFEEICVETTLFDTANSSITETKTLFEQRGFK